LKSKLLKPSQIITLKDYPVHNEQILKIYFRVFQRNQGMILPPCSVIHKSSGIPFALGKDSKSKRYNNLLKKFLQRNPSAEYFLMDGGHKTAAATLAGKQIPAMVIERDSDFTKAKKLIETGEFFGWYSVEKSIKAALAALAKHHFDTKQFLTVEDKVRKMVKNKDVPKYIISFYETGK